MTYDVLLVKENNKGIEKTEDGVKIKSNNDVKMLETDYKKVN